MSQPCLHPYVHWRAPPAVCGKAESALLYWRAAAELHSPDANREVPIRTLVARRRVRTRRESYSVRRDGHVTCDMRAACDTDRLTAVRSSPSASLCAGSESPQL